MAEIELPKGRRKPVSKSPHTLLLYSKPKVGKTTIVSQLENSLLIEHEPHGADFVEANVIEINKPSELKQLFDKIEEAGKPYKYLIIDTITKWDEWSEIVGTLNYMNKSQGKKFNAKDPTNLTKGKYSYKDKEFETVHSLANGAGYAHSRAVMTGWYDRISELADHIIFLAHVKDKFVATDRGDTVEATDISLTGKVKFIYCTRVDSVGMLTKEGNQCIINFDNENNHIVGGRCEHLDGKIVISEKQEDGTIKTYWDKIFIK